MGTQPSVDVPWWWWGTAKPLGKLLSHCPPFLSATRRAPLRLPLRPSCQQQPRPGLCRTHRSHWGQGLRVTTELLEPFSHGWLLLACWSTDLSKTLLYLMSSKGNGDSYVPWNLQSVPRSLLRKARFLLNTLGLILAHVLKMDVFTIHMAKVSHLPWALQTSAHGCFHPKDSGTAVTTGSQQGCSSRAAQSQPSPWQRSLWMFVNIKCQPSVADAPKLTYLNIWKFQTRNQ